MRVGFLVAGAQKAGTTALHHFLEQHPEIGMSEVKELHWFDVDANFGPTADLRSYHARFPVGPETRILGESTPAYMYDASIDQVAIGIRAMVKEVVGMVG